MREGIVKPFAKVNNGTQICEAWRKGTGLQEGFPLGTGAMTKPRGQSQRQADQELEDKSGLQKHPD